MKDSDSVVILRDGSRHSADIAAYSADRERVLAVKAILKSLELKATGLKVRFADPGNSEVSLFDRKGYFVARILTPTINHRPGAGELARKAGY